MWISQRDQRASMKEENIIPVQKQYINIEDFAKIELKVGKILEFHLIEGADKLYRFLVDVGEESPRTILSGIREYFPEGEVFIGKYVCVVANLAPRKMRFGISEGMILACGEDVPALVTIDGAISPGERVR